MKIKLTPQQNEILSALQEWFKKKDSLITVGGYAGTGKTTIIGYLRELLFKENPKLKVAFCSFTGKATRVLSTKLKQNKAFKKDDYIGTIHSLIYSPVLDDKGEVLGWSRRKEMEYDLIVVDEASMIGTGIWADLVSYNIPILAVGDHGQLPPIDSNFNLMEKPMLVLEEIHRQAADNPIIQLSYMARTGGSIPVGEYSPYVKKLLKGSSDTNEEIIELLSNYDENTLVLCGLNSTRNRLNTFIRAKLGIEEAQPVQGDRIICLKNNQLKEIYNGMIGTISHIEEEDKLRYYINITFDDASEYKGLALKEQFNAKEKVVTNKKYSWDDVPDLFDFGYAMTVHKAQGSQAYRVILFEERFAKMDDNQWSRWLYTGITRAEAQLFIIGS